jgi:hypothetical protein
LAIIRIVAVGIDCSWLGSVAGVVAVFASNNRSSSYDLHHCPLFFTGWQILITKYFSVNNWWLCRNNRVRHIGFINWMDYVAKELSRKDNVLIYQ